VNGGAEHVGPPIVYGPSYVVRGMRQGCAMPPVTCHVRYELDPSKLEAFERFAKRWIALVERSGGRHHGYFLPSEGASDVACALHLPQSGRL
jgi:NIPSNAP